MLRIKPDVHIQLGSAAIYEAVKTALLLVPRFQSLPDWTIKVVVVIPDTLMTHMYHMRAPYDDSMQRDLPTFMFDTLKNLGLHSFVEDDDDEVTQTEHDAKLLDVLRMHPDAHMVNMERLQVGSMVYWQPKTEPS
jgi:hypothetical protein